MRAKEGSLNVACQYARLFDTQKCNFAVSKHLGWLVAGETALFAASNFMIHFPQIFAPPPPKKKIQKTNKQISKRKTTTRRNNNDKKMHEIASLTSYGFKIFRIPQGWLAPSGESRFALIYAACYALLHAITSTSPRGKTQHLTDQPGEG